MSSESIVEELKSRLSEHAEHIESKGRKELRRLLGTSSSSWDAIREYQDARGVSIARVHPGLSFLESLGFPGGRSGAHQHILDTLKTVLAGKLKDASQETLLALLNQTVGFITVSDLKSIPIMVLGLLSTVPPKYLKFLCNERVNHVLTELPLSVRQQVWVIDPKLFISTMLEHWHSASSATATGTSAGTGTSGSISRREMRAAGRPIRLICECISRHDDLFSTLAEECCRRVLTGEDPGLVFLLSHSLICLQEQGLKLAPLVKLHELAMLLEQLTSSDAALTVTDARNVLDILRGLVQSQIAGSGTGRVGIGAIGMIKSNSKGKLSSSTLEQGQSHGEDVQSKKRKRHPHRQVTLDPLVMQAMRSGWQFLKDLDSDEIFAAPPDLRSLPGYLKVVPQSQIRDLQSIKEDIDDRYTSFDQLDSDLRLMLANCVAYCGQGSVFAANANRYLEQWGLYARELRARLGLPLVLQHRAGVSVNRSTAVPTATTTAAAACEDLLEEGKKVRKAGPGPGHKSKLNSQLKSSSSSDSAGDDDDDEDEEEDDDDWITELNHTTRPSGTDATAPIVALARPQTESSGRPSSQLPVASRIKSEGLPSSADATATTPAVVAKRKGYDDDDDDGDIDSTPGAGAGIPVVTIASLTVALEEGWRYIDELDAYDIFAEPVTDSIAPGYSHEVRNPMDLSTIWQKIGAESYTTLDEFDDDIVLMLSNCMLYNGYASELGQGAKTILDKWVDKATALERRLTGAVGRRAALLDGASATYHTLEAAWEFLMDLDADEELFRYPLTENVLPGYFDIIPRKNARDLTTIGIDISRCRYPSIEALNRDVELMFNNCIAFHGPDASFSHVATTFLSMWHQKRASLSAGTGASAGVSTAHRGTLSSSRYISSNSSGGALSLADALKSGLATVVSLDSEGIFALPVSAATEGYFDVIARENARDISLIAAHVRRRTYQCLKALHDDVQLMLQNCVTFNGMDSDYGEIAVAMRAAWCIKYDELKSRMSAGPDSDLIEVGRRGVNSSSRPSVDVPTKGVLPTNSILKRPTPSTSVTSRAPPSSVPKRGREVAAGSGSVPETLLDVSGIVDDGLPSVVADKKLSIALVLLREQVLQDKLMRLLFDLLRLCGRNGLMPKDDQIIRGLLQLLALPYLTNPVLPPRPDLVLRRFIPSLLLRMLRPTDKDSGKGRDSQTDALCSELQLLESDLHPAEWQLLRAIGKAANSQVSMITKTKTANTSLLSTTNR